MELVNKRVVVFFGALSIVLLVTTAVLTVLNIDLNQKRSELSETNNKATEKILAQQKIIETETAKLISDRDRCLKKIADPTKQDIEDMRDYIMARYSSVPEELAFMISETTSMLAKEHKIDFSLVVGLMEVESGFNPFAVSKAGARGLLQVMPKVWGEQHKIVNPSELHGIRRGISVGIQVLKFYVDKNEGKLTPALAAYNGSKGKEFANSVYLATGRFTCFRNNTYGRKDTEEETIEEENGKAISAGDTEVPNGLR